MEDGQNESFMCSYQLLINAPGELPPQIIRVQPCRKHTALWQQSLTSMGMLGCHEATPTFVFYSWMFDTTIIPLVLLLIVLLYYCWYYPYY